MRTAWVVLALLVVGCGGAGDQRKATESPAAVDHAPAYALLDQYVTLMRTVGGGADPSAFVDELPPHKDAARTLREQGQVDDAFVARHAALIEVTADFLRPGGVGDAAVEARIRAWAGGVPEAPALDAGALSMATLMPVVVEELVNLRLMIADDGWDREAARKALRLEAP